jgi:hypothetical protein
VGEIFQVEAGIVFESPDQKTQVFLVFIVLLWCFLKHVHKIFGEISVRVREVCRSDFGRGCLACDFCLHRLVFPWCFLCPKPVPRTSSLQ